MFVARWIQCHHAISECAILAKQPTSGQAVASLCQDEPGLHVAGQQPEVSDFPDCEETSLEFTGATPQNNVMERLLRSQGKRHDNEHYARYAACADNKADPIYQQCEDAQPGVDHEAALLPPGVWFRQSGYCRQ